MRSLRVFEEVADAFLLEQPRDEIEIGLPVLHAVLPGQVLRLVRQPVVDRLGRLVAEDQVDDLGHVLRLEDPAVRGPAQEPQPRMKRQVVDEVATLAAPQRKPRYVAVVLPLQAVVEVDRDRQRLAQQVARPDVRLQAHRIQPDDEEAGQPFAHVHPREQQRVAERAGQRAEAVHVDFPSAQSTPRGFEEQSPVGDAEIAGSTLQVGAVRLPLPGQVGLADPRQHGVGQDRVDHPPAAVDLGAAADDQLERPRRRR